jgi:hypothetical protein
MCVLWKFFITNWCILPVFGFDDSIHRLIVINISCHFLEFLQNRLSKFDSMIIHIFKHRSVNVLELFFKVSTF